MKYVIRAIKYFFYFSIITTGIILALILIGAVEGGIDSIFEDGYNAIWKIAIFFAFISAVYPKLAFIKRDVNISGDWKEIRQDVIDFFSERRYELESEDDQSATFRLRSRSGRILKMYEDRLIFSKSPMGYTLEGLRKDALHLSTALEHRFTQH